MRWAGRTLPPEELARIRHIQMVYTRTANLSGALQSSGSGTLANAQRPEARVEEMSWYWRFLLMMTLLRKLSWTCKFKESGLSTI